MNNKDFNNISSLMDEIADLKKQLEIKTKANEYLREKLRISGVGSSLISEEEFNTMANDYIKLECHKYDGFNIKAQRFQDYRNGLKNMHKVLK